MRCSVATTLGQNIEPFGGHRCTKCLGIANNVFGISRPIFSEFGQRNDLARNVMQMVGGAYARENSAV